jgi:hypothetical protein
MELLMQHQSHAHQGIRADPAVFHDAKDLRLSPATTKTIKAVCKPILMKCTCTREERRARLLQTLEGHY